MRSITPPASTLYLVELTSVFTSVLTRFEPVTLAWGEGEVEESLKVRFCSTYLKTLQFLPLLGRQRSLLILDFDHAQFPGSFLGTRLSGWLVVDFEYFSFRLRVGYDVSRS